MEIEARKRFLINISFTAVVIGLIFFTVKFLLAYLLPFVIGIVLAVFLQKPSKIAASKLKLETGTCAAILTAVTFILLIIALFLISWQAISAFLKLSSSNSGILTSMGDRLLAMESALQEKIALLPERLSSPLKNFTKSSVDSIISKAGNVMSSLAAQIVKRMPAFLLSFIVTFVAGCYIAKDFEGLLRFTKGLIKPDRLKRLHIIKDIVINRVFRLILGYLVLMLITFIELLAGFLIIGIDNAFITALITAFLDLLPVLGTGIVIIPWAIFCFILGSVSKGIGLLVLYAIITIVRNLIEPKIIGKQIGITPLLTLLTIFLGLKLAGVAGMILLPLTVIVTFDFYRQQTNEVGVADKSGNA